MRDGVCYQRRSTPSGFGMCVRNMLRIRIEDVERHVLKPSSGILVGASAQTHIVDPISSQLHRSTKTLHSSTHMPKALILTHMLSIKVPRRQLIKNQHTSR